MRIYILVTILANLIIQTTCSSYYAQDGYGGDDYADYQDYAGEYGTEDNLYYDYAQRKEMKS
jgi:hypothetical protein